MVRVMRSAFRITRSGSSGSANKAPPTATAAHSVAGRNLLRKVPSRKLARGKKKLSYLEAREYASIEDKVEAAEERLNIARDLLDEPSVATNADALTAALHEMEQAQAAADELYASRLSTD